jgi:hypothetical protein
MHYYDTPQPRARPNVPTQLQGPAQRPYTASNNGAQQGPALDLIHVHLHARTAKRGGHATTTKHTRAFLPKLHTRHATSGSSAGS